MGPVFVFMAIMIAIGIAAYLTVNAFSRERKKGVGAKITAVAACVAAAVFTLAVADYLDASDRNVEYTLYAVVELEKPHGMDAGEWDGIHEKEYDENYAQSFRSSYGEDWPELNVQEYSYIICYGQQLRSLTYNVWNTIDIPIRTGLLEGKAMFCEGYDPNTIYIYRIPKLKIDHYPWI